MIHCYLPFTAPDDILGDNDPYHIFKLFTDQDFPGHGITGLDTFDSGGITYYKFSGGLPYRIDHIVQEIISMTKLRAYNDQLSWRQIFYYYLLLSHYLTDAHVPMHCDLRDDPPDASSRDGQPSRLHKGGKPATGPYMNGDAHAALEGDWEDAVIPVAIAERIIEQHPVYQQPPISNLTPQVTFTGNDCQSGGVIVVKTIPERGLMQFLIDLCIKSKIRCKTLFPIANPTQLDTASLPAITRQIFADAIGNLLSVWKYFWDQTH